MTTPSSFLDRLPTIGGAIALILAITTVIVASNNRGLQETLNAGQKKLAEAQTAGNVNNSLIRLLATAAVEHNDPEIKALLAANGITYRQNAQAAPASTSSPAREGGK